MYLSTNNAILYEWIVTVRQAKPNSMYYGKMGGVIEFGFSVLECVCRVQRAYFRHILVREGQLNDYRKNN